MSWKACSAEAIPTDIGANGAKGVEEAHIKARELPESEAKRIRGRGKVEFVSEETHPKVHTHKQGKDETWERTVAGKAERTQAAGRMLM